MNQMNNENYTDLKNIGRFIILTGEVNEESAINCVHQMIQYQYESITKDITLLIDSYGGDAYSMNMILDTMKIVSCDVRTLVLGKAMSAGAIIFANGTPGKRYMSKNAYLMLHQVNGGLQGDTKSMNIAMDHIKMLQENAVKNLANVSKLNVHDIKNLIDRDAYLSVDDAIKMGFCDKLLTELV